LEIEIERRAHGLVIAFAPIARPRDERRNGAQKCAAMVLDRFGEALPVASIASSEVLSETARQTDLGAGVCVGRRFPGIEWRVVEIHDGPIDTIHATNDLPQGKIGELIVRGPVVTTEYVTRTDANAIAKIDDNDEGFWHRMGDVGYLDEQNRFWFCGRMSQRVPFLQRKGDPENLFTIPCEAIFNTHPDVFRSALVGVGPRAELCPVVIVEPLPGRRPKNRAQRSEARHDWIDHLPVSRKLFRQLRPYTAELAFLLAKLFFRFRHCRLVLRGAIRIGFGRLRFLFDGAAEPIYPGNGVSAIHTQRLLPLSQCT
jgi:acyl-CoA synthetase (AMP-forming)/AMP-acid ligase II